MPARRTYFPTQNGRIKIQAETLLGTSPSNGWVYQPPGAGNNAGAQGGYYYFKSETLDGSVKSATQGLFSATIYIDEAGRLHLRVRTARDTNDPGDSRNDIWVRVDDDIRPLLPEGTVPVSLDRERLRQAQGRQHRLGLRQDLLRLAGGGRQPALPGDAEPGLPHHHLRRPLGRAAHRLLRAGQTGLTVGATAPDTADRSAPDLPARGGRRRGRQRRPRRARRPERPHGDRGERPRPRHGGGQRRQDHPLHARRRLLRHRQLQLHRRERPRREHRADDDDDGRPPRRTTPSPPPTPPAPSPAPRSRSRCSATTAIRTAPASRSTASTRPAPPAAPSRSRAAQLRYTPAAGFTGTDSFSYDVVDPTGRVSDRATVAVAVAEAPAPGCRSSSGSTAPPPTTSSTCSPTATCSTPPSSPARRPSRSASSPAARSTAGSAA